MTIPPPLRRLTSMRGKLRVPEWYVSSLMMDWSLDEVCRRVKKIDRRHDVPYLAGYSKNGKTIFIDRHTPKTFMYRNRRISTDRFLVLHEAVEKALIDQLKLNYLHAHQIATRAEQAAVRAEGISWRAYDQFMKRNVKRIGDETLTKVPRDLDLKPYRDEHDTETLRRMMVARDSGRFRMGFRAFRVLDRTKGDDDEPARRTRSRGKISGKRRGR